jgi:hypothetical protein
MSRFLKSRFVDCALRGAALVVTDRRWAAPLSAAALGFGIFAGVAIGPGAAGTMATGAQQIVELPSSGGGEGQSGGGGGGTASTESAAPFEAALRADRRILPLGTACDRTGRIAAPARYPSRPRSRLGRQGSGRTGGSRSGDPGGDRGPRQPAAGSYAMAIEGGELVSVHAPQLPEPGTKLSAPLRRLANDTFARPASSRRRRRRRARPPSAGLSPSPTPTRRLRPTPSPAGRFPARPRRARPGRHRSPAARDRLLRDRHRDDRSRTAVEPNAVSALVQRKIEIEPGPPSTYLDLAGIVKEVPSETTSSSYPPTDPARAKPPSHSPSARKSTQRALKPGDSYLATATVEEDGSSRLRASPVTSAPRAPTTRSAQGDLKR